MTAIYGILDTETNQFVSYGSKIAWATVGNAKNAYACHRHYKDNVKFNDQTRYIIVELTEAYFRLEGLDK